MLGRGIQGLLVGRGPAVELTETVEIAMPDLARMRAEEIVRLSRDYSDYGAGFKSTGEVLGPALLYGLAHMYERYSEAVKMRDELRDRN
jgi:hypothetical protein